MIPLLVLAIVLSAAAATYEFSPRAHSWVDDHVRALRGLVAAIRTANAHVDAARAAPDPATAAEQLRSATAAKQEAAHQAVIAADTARTDDQRATAARGAAAVDGVAAAITSLRNLVTGATSWIDEHTRALAGALAAHSVADANLAAATATPPSQPTVAADHAATADAANRVAAAETMAAAATAQTDQQRQAAAQSASVVADRDKKIVSVFASLGLGLCDVRSYSRVTPRVRDALIARLHAAGMSVTGKNPWDIDPNQLGIKLRAAWDSKAQELRIIVTTNPGGKILCPAIWAQIDPIMKEITTAGAARS